MNKNLAIGTKLLALLCALFIFTMPFTACAKEKEKTAEQLYSDASVSICSVGSVYSKGTGFVIKTDTQAFYILTNKHVVSSGSFVSDTASIVFANKMEYTASVIGYSTYHDLAVLKVDKAPHEKLTALTLPKKNMLNGQKVFVIGDALGMGLSIFEGLVSFNDRALYIESEQKRVPVMQITAPVNEGCSGAPVLDSSGAVAGVATYQITLSAGRPVDGVSFCVSASIARAVSDEIMRAYIKDGVTGECELLDIRLSKNDVGVYTAIDAYALNFSGYITNSGIVLTHCASIESADDTQLAVGDVITSVGKTELSDTMISDIFCEFYKYADSRVSLSVNENAPLKIAFMRNGNKMELTVLNKYEKIF